MTDQPPISQPEPQRRPRRPVWPFLVAGLALLVMICCVGFAGLGALNSITGGATATPILDPKAEPSPTLEASPTATVASSPTMVPATPETAATPEPEATETPEPTPTREPQPTAEPEPTPTIEPIRYEGSGDDVIAIERPGGLELPFLAEITGNAEGQHFAVRGIDASNNPTELLVNTTEPYEGVVLVDARSLTTTRLEITAPGSWTIELRPLTDARPIEAPGSLEGNGDDVLLVDGAASTAVIEGNAGGQHFAVIAHGDQTRLLVNTTDPYEGRTLLPPNTLFLQITAVGPWAVTLE